MRPKRSLYAVTTDKSGVIDDKQRKGNEKKIKETKKREQKRHRR